MRYWFCADYHLGHKNIMKYCGRTLFMTKKDLHNYNEVKGKNQEEQTKFKLSDKSLRNMNKGMIKRHNERVKKDDDVIHIGDFCFRSKNQKGNGIGVKAKEWERKLNGKMIFIRGSHDSNNSCKTNIENLVIHLGGYRINLVHNPCFVDVNYEINLVGHVHNKWKFKRIYRSLQFTDAINVGCDVWNFYPITIEEILKEYVTWKKAEGLS